MHNLSSVYSISTIYDFSKLRKRRLKWFHQSSLFERLTISSDTLWVHGRKGAPTKCLKVSFYKLSENWVNGPFSVLVITCQSLLQLQIIRGKKQWNSYGRIIPCIGICVLAGMFWSVVILLQDILLPASSNPCQPLCAQNSTSVREVENISLGIYFGFTLLPTSTIVILTSVWSVQLFKKMSIQQKIHDYNTLNKKLLFMPILMVILIVFNGLVGYLVGIALSEVIKLAGVEDYLGNWAYFARRMSYGFISCLHGVSYPITLLYFNTKLRKNWRKYLTRRSNRVDSEIITVQ